MPDLSHFWQRFVQASALIFGLALGVAATVFAYSNTAEVTVGWSVFHLGKVPVWSVAIVPIVIVLVAATVYHWWKSFHHFTEHMRHRRRVHELEAEVKALKGQLDGLLGMPDHEHSREEVPAEPLEEIPALPQPASSNGGDKTPKRERKRVTVTTTSEPEPVRVASAPADGTEATEPTTEPPKEANSEG